jgi:hypothetical protein
VFAIHPVRQRGGGQQLVELDEFETIDAAAPIGEHHGSPAPRGRRQRARPAHRELIAHLARRGLVGQQALETGEAARFR